ncbi:MAG: LacI family transcriptional regulator [Provencibacterium sp.]|nr:LacI family transcriptional regulator [Provencibacterium sp.]
MKTIKDVAKAADVSVATVSRVLNNDSAVAAATREHVLQVIAEVGYAPNALGRNLRRNATRRVLVLLPSIAHEFLAGVVRGAEQAAWRRGYQIVVSMTHANAELERQYVHMLLQRSVDGILFMSSHLPAQELSELSARYPAVMCDECIEGAKVPYVGIDNEQAAYEVTRYLIKGGCRRIAIIAHPQGYASRLRTRGYQRALREMGLCDRPEYHAKGDYSFASGARACRQLFSLAEPPDAIFASSDLMAAGVIRRMHEMGLRPGEDAAIFGFDNIHLARILTPTLSTVSQSKLQLGRKAMELLLERIENPGCESRDACIGHRLIFRESTRRIEKTAQAD